MKYNRSYYYNKWKSLDYQDEESIWPRGNASYWKYRYQRDKKSKEYEEPDRTSIINLRKTIAEEERRNDERIEKKARKAKRAIKKYFGGIKKKRATRTKKKTTNAPKRHNFRKPVPKRRNFRRPTLKREKVEELVNEEDVIEALKEGKKLMKRFNDEDAFKLDRKFTSRKGEGVYEYIETKYIGKAIEAVEKDHKYFDEVGNYVSYLYNMVDPIFYKVKEFLRKYRRIRYQIIYKYELHRVTALGLEQTIEWYANTTLDSLSRVGDLEDLKSLMALQVEYILDKVESSVTRNSGWKFRNHLELRLSLSSFPNKLDRKGSSYIDLKSYNSAVYNTKAIINPKNEDDKCMLYALTLYYMDKNKEIGVNKLRMNKIKEKAKEYVKEPDNIVYPFKLQKIKSFERANNIRINVFHCRKMGKVKSKACDYITPLYVSKLDYKEECDLVIFGEESEYHYAYIRNFDRLMSSTTKHECRTFRCKRCMSSFNTEKSLMNHQITCNENDTVRVSCPKKGSKIKFKNLKNKQRAPFVIYADFESFLEKKDEPVKKNLREGETSNTNITQKHIPSGFFYLVVTRGNYNLPMEYTYKYIKFEEDDTEYSVANKSIKALLDTCNKVKKMLNVEMKMTEEDKLKFKRATHCHICKNKLMCNKEKKYIDKVRDHDHLTGEYRGAAHKACNLNYSHKRSKIPIFCHNSKGYDNHFLIKGISNIKSDKGVIRLVPENKEKYKTIQYGDLEFKDSFSFLSSSLSSLVDNLQNGKAKHRFKYLEKYAPLLFNKKMTEEDFNLIKRKGVYPYEYMDSFQKFKETKLPAIEKFYSSLNYESVSKADYEHAQFVWKKFNIKNLEEYHRLYLITDVLLLADVFERFRDISIENYSLDPAHYITLPSYGWDSMLLKTGVSLEQITDTNMYEFLERGIRGGISQISHRYAKANNKYLKDYNPKEKSSYIAYVDANNLYGWAMSQRLPISNFKWLSDEELEFMNDDIDLVNNFNAEGREGLILEVDLEYPEHLHDKHNQYPMAPESMTIKDDMLSEYAKKIRTDHNLSKVKVNKLCTTLKGKKNYIVHYRNLKLYLKHGLKLTKIHKGISFTQELWLKPWIDLNTKKRQNAKNNFEKDFYKLMNNSVFGKTMQNVRRYKDFTLFTKFNEELSKKMESYLVKSYTILESDKLLLMEMNKRKCVLDKPIYAGFSILDLSKIVMYKHHYEYMLPKYNDNCKLLFTDTDSLTYQVFTEDLYADMKKDANERFDFSAYPKDHLLHNEKNKKVPGFMSDETPDHYVSEFVGLKSKMYSFLLQHKYKDEKYNKRTCKGVKKGIIKKFIHHDSYKYCLKRNEVQRLDENPMVTFRSKNHEIFTLSQNKISLSCYDDKRYILNDGVTSFAYGHYKINK